MCVICPDELKRKIKMCSLSKSFPLLILLNPDLNFHPRRPTLQIDVITLAYQDIPLGPPIHVRSSVPEDWKALMSFQVSPSVRSQVSESFLVAVCTACRSYLQSLTRFARMPCF